MPVLLLPSGPKIGFCPDISAPINMKFGTGSRSQVHSTVPNFTFIGGEMWEYSPLSLLFYTGQTAIKLSGAEAANRAQ